ncbi:MAG: MBL fold metallo-hydrolase [Flavobacteriaceae bacterium]|jgi:phosphoribosyl 1,2-cyclic phosphate phosphodiesterase|nr:MBL fold metallo-hydrolase [Flavobacteriaceae bacterium]
MAELIFLGTGTSQGVPVVGSKDPVCLSSNAKDKRLRTSAFVKFNNLDLLIDCGPDFRQQMLRENLWNIDAILLTHEHSDHVGGMDDLRPVNFLKQSDLPIYGMARVLESIKIRYAYAFGENKYPGSPTFDLHEVDNEFDIEGLKVTPIQVTHGELPILGYKIADLTYITDASFVSEEEIEKIKPTKIMVVNALRKQPHRMHFSLPQALEFIKKVQPEKAFIVHIGFPMGFHDEVQKELPANVFLAYDGLRVKF